MIKLKFTIATLIMVCVFTGHTMAQLEFYDPGTQKNISTKKASEYTLEDIPSVDGLLRSANPEWFEEYMNAVQDELMYPGVSACVLRDGQLFWKSHHGLSNIGAATPVTDETAYTVASISKTIMITAVMQLYEQQLFDLDDDISDHIPFLVRNYNHPDEVISIKQLMTHTSSIADNYTILNDLLFFGGDNPVPMNDFLEGYLTEEGEYYMLDNYYSYAPGATFNYTNVGSCLVACLVETKSGLDFETYCQTHVFGPLGMEATSYLFANLDPQNLATPYTISSGNIYFTAQSSWPIYAIGNLKVSALQLAKHLCMYMNQGSYNGSTLLQASTIDLITDHHYINPGQMVYMGLIWFVDPYPWFYSHTGRWYGFNTMYGFNKEDNYGMVWLSNGDNIDQIEITLGLWYSLILYAAQYEPFSIESMAIADENGNGIMEAGEVVDLYLDVRNFTNIADTATNLEISLNTASPLIELITDPVTSPGDLPYLETFNNSVDPVSFKLSDPLEPGYIEFDIAFSWNENYTYETTLKLYAGNTDILLVRDETDVQGLYYQTSDWYTSVLDSLGYHYHYYDKDVRGDPTQAFINQFPVVIWYTGFDSTNTLTIADQELLSGFLDNGGKLFLSGQNISDELEGSDFLTNYLHVIHVENTWTGMQAIGGIDNDLLGDGLVFTINQGDAVASQYSMSVVEPLDGAQKSFGYWSDLEGAGIRYEDNNYKTVFFAFGFESINDFENRYEIMRRILDDYFGVIVSNNNIEDPAISGLQLRMFPNPFTSSMEFSWHLAERSDVNLQVYDLHGKLMCTLINETRPEGEHALVYSDPDLPAGVYFCVIRTKRGIQTAKVIKL